MSESRTATMGAKEVLEELDSLWSEVARKKETARAVNRYQLVREFLKAVADGRDTIEVLPS